MTVSRRAMLGGTLAVGASALAACSSSEPWSSIPSPSSTSTASSADAAASLALYVAGQAAAAGSYGIGGVLLDQATGNVLQSMPNRVFAALPANVASISGTVFVQDPTAHGERQLMSWYLAQREALRLPAPENLLVLTTVDPCLMCASSLLEVGVNVGVVAPDTYSGVNFALTAQFDDLPEPLRSRARERFAYYAVDGVRGYQGPAAGVFAGQSVARDTYDQCVSLYAQTADTVRADRRGTAVAPDKLTDPATDGASSPIVRAFQSATPWGFAARLPEPRLPGQDVRELLEDCVRATPGASNACAFVDPFGNVLVATADQQQVNPLSTAFALCTRTYAQTRFALAADLSTAKAAAQSLTNPNFGTFVWLNAPNPLEAAGMFDIGAYGSSLGAASTPLIPGAFTYFTTPSGVSATELQDVIWPLPPLYSEGIAIVPHQLAPL